MNSFLVVSKRRVALAISAAIFLRFLLLPTANAFYELYHFTHLDPFYWGYSFFKVTSYYLATWPYQNVACVGIPLLIVVPWRKVFRSMKTGVMHV